METFAHQAVIALENVRLFQELGARNRELTEALDQQTATSEVLKVISRSTFDLEPVLDTLIESATRLCGATAGFIWRFDGEVFRLASAHGASLDLRSVAAQRGDRAGPEPHRPNRARAARDSDSRCPGRSGLSAHRVAAVGRVPDDAGRAHAEGRAAPRGHRRCGGRRSGRSATSRSSWWTTFADQAVIAIENVRLFQELEARNRDLTETLEQRTATAEILRVISSSPTDVQPVFDTIVASAVRLCGARMGAVYRFDGELMHLVAHRNYSPEVLELLQRMHPRPPQPDQASGKAVLTRAVAQIEDMLADPSYVREVAVIGGWRSILAVPMLRDGVPSGAIVITRSEAGPFSDGHVELVKTFADQAVIAIENVRLFQELQARNRELTEALEQQTATAEFLRVISSSPTDLQPVMATVVENAARLCGASDSSIFRLDGDVLRLSARYGTLHATLGIGDAVAATRDTAAGRAVAERRTIHVEELRALPETEFPDTRARQGELGSTGTRTLLVAPLLREGVPVGALLVRRGGGPALLGGAGRTAGDLRRPGGHRHRERAAVPGAGGAESRADGSPGAADGDRRDPAGDLQLTDRPPAGHGHGGGERRAALRALDSSIFRLDGMSCGWWPDTERCRPPWVSGAPSQSRATR